MPSNILVEDDVLDAIAFQAGFIGGYLIGLIVTGHKTSNTSVVLGNLSDRQQQSSLKRAIELNPDYATAHRWYANLLDYSGPNEEATREILRA